jgi:hypothetical protein
MDEVPKDEDGEETNKEKACINDIICFEDFITKTSLLYFVCICMRDVWVLINHPLRSIIPPFDD